VIEVFVVASWDGTNWPAPVDGSGDAARTLTSADIKAASCRAVAAMQTDNVSNRTYFFAPTSVASLFGGCCPPRFVIFVAHSTGVALNATATNHQIRVLPVYETVV
jgi:hypothetical protein